MFPKTCCKIIDGQTTCITERDKQVCLRRDVCNAELLPGGSGGGTCFSAWEKNRTTNIAVFLTIILYLFLGITIICDEYFVPALERISATLDLSDDVAGATFMAVGGSAPECFVSLLDNILSSSPKDLGVGTILGSAIFNFLVIIGVSAVFSGATLQLDWKPLARDTFFYLISILLLIIVVHDNHVKIYEALILIAVYLLYVLFMVHNQRIFQWADRATGKTKPPVSEVADEINALAEITADEMGEKEMQTVAERKFSHISLSSLLGEELNPDHIIPESRASYLHVFHWPILKTKDDRRSYFQKAMGDWDKLWRLRMYFLLSFPIQLVVRFTCPDSSFDVFHEDKKGRPEKRVIGFTLGFVMSLVWISIFSYFLVYAASIFGCAVGLDPAVVGLTLVAAGTSVPDTILSVLVAIQGKADMAVANSIGANIFDILMGLGFPWLAAILGFGKDIQVKTDDFLFGSIYLFCCVLGLFVVLMIFKFRLSIPGGMILNILYLFYIIYELAVKDIIIE